MDPKTKLFGTKDQVKDYTGVSDFTAFFLWECLKNGSMTDQDIIKAVEKDPTTDVRLCYEALQDKRTDAAKIAKEETRKAYKKSKSLRRPGNGSKPFKDKRYPNLCEKVPDHYNKIFNGRGRP